jgi:hypothetical protein
MDRGLLHLNISCDRFYQQPFKKSDRLPEPPELLHPIEISLEEGVIFL